MKQAPQRKSKQCSTLQLFFLCLLLLVIGWLCFVVNSVQTTPVDESVLAGTQEPTSASTGEVRAPEAEPAREKTHALPQVSQVQPEKPRLGASAATPPSGSGATPASQTVSQVQSEKPRLRASAATPPSGSGATPATHAGLSATPASQTEKTEPQLEELMRRLGAALMPYQENYRRALASADSKNACYDGPKPNSYVPDCATDCTPLALLEEAKALCTATVACGGITRTSRGFELRRYPRAESSKGAETSWVKIPCGITDVQWRKAQAADVWKTFHDTLDAALSDPSLHLDAKYGEPRDDDSVFLSIAAYRDNTCHKTLSKSFERADHPERLFVGLVQMNCQAQRGCYTGTGWGNTRQWVPQKGPDPDCAGIFCASDLGKKYCEAGQLRVLKLDETDSLGPFFTRFLNSHLWRGEAYFMQIDAHTDFRTGWDTTLIDMMKKTPSYPYSVISNYPPSGSPSSERPWKRVSSRSFGNPNPAALCSCHFEELPGGSTGEKKKTVRLTSTMRRAVSEDAARPRHTGFVAAGFFFSHGSLAQGVPFDPFLPYIFMGEEIAMSIRFWTAGYDIYGPTVDVLAHEYVRKEAPKYWESVNSIFSNPAIHNDLTDLLMPRLMHLVGYGEMKDRKKVPATLATRMDTYGLGSMRSGENFTKLMGFNMKALTQHQPHWCVTGDWPPIVRHV